MRSQLTRNVFRQLLSSEGLIFRCPRQSALANCRIRNEPFLLARRPQRRSLFGLSRDLPKEPKPASLDPGLEDMLQLSLREKTQVQPPPRDQMLKAWRAFFNDKYHSASREPINNLIAGHVLRTFQYLQRAPEFSGTGDGLNHNDLRKASTVLARMPKDNVETHQELARLIYADLLKISSRKDNDRHLDISQLVNVLTRTGASLEARNFIQELEDKYVSVDEEVAGQPRLVYNLWHLVIKGFAKENNATELLKTWEMAEAHGVAYDQKFHNSITAFFASRNDIETTKAWYNKPITSAKKLTTPGPESIETILEFCVRNDEMEWCKTVFRDLLEDRPSKAIWDIVIRWAAGAMGKGVEDVEKMLEVMIRRNEDDPSLRPDVTTINGLVRLAISRSDPYLAERYITLGMKFGIQPNASTFILQMDYRVGANDLRGAQASYEALQAEEIVGNQDLPVINRYIRALCATGEDKNYDRMVSILADLEERNAKLEAETVISIALAYLDRSETEAVVDLVQQNAYHYTVDERAAIIEAFRGFCLNREISTTRVWNAYNILQGLFDETSTEIRTELMNEFFLRERCDMAVYTFGHMRQHNIPSRRPVLSTYVQCFVGIAKCADREYLDIVHNMMKMDVNIEPNTKLYNSLMLAYTACDDADRAFNFWDDITNSYEGPTYKSIEIVFWACQRRPFGDGRAMEIWKKMRKMDIEVTSNILAAYVGALAGNGKFEEARIVVDSAEKELGVKPDVNVLGTLYNSLHGQDRKDVIEQWGKDTYPTVWEELEKLGRYEDEHQYRQFNIEREFEA